MDNFILDFPVWGLFELSWWGYALFSLLITHTTIASVTIYLHRCQTHKAIELHPIMSHFFRIWLFLTSGLNTVQWVSVHRKHHDHTDTSDDPHSPQIFGIRNILLTGVERYRESARNPSVTTQYGHGTPNDWLERSIYSPLSYRWSWIPGSVLLLILFGVPAIVMLAVIGAWTPIVTAGIINGLGHWPTFPTGYRNFSTKDTSSNIILLGLFIGGEELHNNHHRFPRSAKFSVRLWEIDIGWLYIRILSRFGLAKIKNIHPFA